MQREQIVGENHVVESGNDDADHLRPRRRELARRKIGNVAELLDGRLDAPAQLLRNRIRVRIARDTVIGLTLASFATSVIVTLRIPTALFSHSYDVDL